MKFASQIWSKHEILAHAKKIGEEGLAFMVEGNEGTIALEDRCIYITINVIYSLHVSYFGVAMTKYLADTKKKMIFLNSRCQRSFHLAGSPWQNRVTPLW